MNTIAPLTFNRLELSILRTQPAAPLQVTVERIVTKVEKW